MSSYDPSLFNTSPYYDDFNEDKKFHRILFRPGYAVQSRELTQLQTILQNQIERFGNHVFKDGSRIIGGEISTQTLDFVRVRKNTISTPISTIATDDIVGFGLVQKDGSGNVLVRAKVLDIVREENFDVLVVSYLSGDVFTEGATLDSENPDKVLQVAVANLANTPTGRCKVVAVNEGIYYINGYFVKTTPQIEPAYNVVGGANDFTNPTGYMGFKVVSTIVTDKEDFTLKDPASGSYNYNAPGAHRYKIDLVLSFVDTLADEDFIQLVEYSNGTIVKRYEESQYSELLRLFAQRTYDESGNYIVRPFDISFRNGSGNTFFADIGSGKAYVFGYEFETKFKETIELPKARTLESYSDNTIPNYFGNYIRGSYTPGPNGDRFNQLFAGVGGGSVGQNSVSFMVYGATGPADGATLTNAYFTASLVRIEPSGSNITTQGGASLQINAHLTDIRYLQTNTANPNSAVNLYLLDKQTNVSYRLMSNVLINGRLPIVTNSTNQSLVYEANGSSPTTLIKNMNELSYVHEVFRGFVVSADNRQPTVPLNLGSEYDWCLVNGVVPSGSDVDLKQEDGYYLVYNSGTDITIGSMIKVVGTQTAVPTGTKATAKITGDGDAIKFTSDLPVGSYFLVGKAKNVSENITSSPSGKIRTKTLTSATEVINNTTTNLDTFKRVISTNSSGSIYEMYFVIGRADVLRITSIVDGTGVDISDEFLFDNGQRDATYDLARLYVKPEYFDKYDSGSAFTISLGYDYFAHSGYGPFTVESYQGISYDNIPVFTSTLQGKSVNLQNAIDFRYVATISGTDPAGVPIVTYQNGFAPMPFSVQDTHTAYLPRIDKIVVNKNLSTNDPPTIQRIAGVPSNNPLVPEDLSDSMTLFVASVPAYTFDAKDIKTETIGNSRFTMKDVGDISKRVDNLEQYAVLNSLELDIVSRSLTTISGEDAVKKAILADTFDGHSIADVENVDHRCAIDVERGELRASFKSDAYEFEYTGSDVNLLRTTDNILCYNYTKFATPVVTQDKASTTVKVNPFDLPNWVGNIKLTPHGDYWFDSTIRPIVKINDTGFNDSWLVSDFNDGFGFGSQWNDWESIWSGIAYELDDAETKKNANYFINTISSNAGSVVKSRFSERNNIRRYTASVEEIRSSYTDNLRKKDFYKPVATSTLINKSVVPYMRNDKTLTFSVYNMKPKTSVHIFFDNVNVDSYCSVGGVTGAFTTDENNGSITNITFVPPSGMFEAGEKLLRVIDSTTNTIENATTIAEASFHVSGIKEDDFTGVVSIRPAEFRKQTPNSNKIVSNPLFRQKSINTNSFTQWIDPLAQTFSVTESSYPNGYFLDSVDIFVATKDTLLPLTVEIRPVVNGLPHPSVVVPFSTVVKNPSQITANANTPTATNFKFSTPVYLAPGDYAVIVRANSGDYSLFAAEIGEFDLVTNERISSTFDGGVLFRAHNSGEPTGDPDIDIMFNLNRCQFNTQSNNSITISHVAQTDTNIANLIQVNPFVFVPPAVNTTIQVKLGASTYDVVPFRNFDLPTEYVVDETATLDMIVTSSVASTGLLTPMIDLDKTNVVVVENVINSSNDNTRELSPVSGMNDSTARYISKKVKIPNGKADQIKVLLDANLPQGTFIRVYAKTFDSSTVVFSEDTAGYRLLTSVNDPFLVGGTTSYSQNKFDFREMLFQDGTLVQNFDTFAVKVCLYSTDSNTSPVIKNLRIVAVE